jgi:hypothetical protein
MTFHIAAVFSARIAGILAAAAITVGAALIPKTVILASSVALDRGGTCNERRPSRLRWTRLRW